FTSTITRIVCLLALAGLIGLASKRRTGFSVADTSCKFFNRFRSVRFQEEDRGSGNTRLRERSTAFAPNLGSYGDTFAQYNLRTSTPWRCLCPSDHTNWA